ncbi:MAG: 2-phospho-L-lactate guanylyltransferase [Myxococcales bacterium]|nr:2-phospho-L-lactate guanylyltransferase [Myxococcales bacterium]
MSAADARPWVVLPVKGFTRAKSRLAGSLPPSPRAQLARTLFERAVAAARECPRVGGVLIATDGNDVERICTTLGLPTLRDARGATLSAVIDAGLDHLLARQVSRAIVLMADLPEIMPRAIDEVARELEPGRLVLVPDAARRGTNALGLTLGTEPPFRTCFGNPDSLQRHVRRAAEHGLEARVLVQPRVAFDLDRPVDLARATR